MLHIKNKIKLSELDLQEKVIAVNRVTKVVRGGRRFSFSAIIVVGDGKGIVGYGLGKANEVTDAISKGVDRAKKNLIKIAIIKGTIPHLVTGKFDGGRVLLKPASQGTGVIAGAGVRIILESVGIHNILAKSQGSSNPHNLVKATFEALTALRDPYTIAAQRGISLDKLFNG